MKNYIVLLCLFSLGAGCVKHRDLPPEPARQQLTPNITLRELRQMHFPGNTEKIIEDLVAEGVVVANDSLDNFYKTIVVQDATGGISIKIDATQLYLLFPVGQKIFIRLRGCWLGDYGGLLQLGAGSDKTDSLYPRLISIPVPLIQQILIAGERGQSPAPKEVLISQLSDSLQNCLVRVKEVEFIAADTSRPFADALNRQSVNHVLTSCVGGSVYLRTSGFSRFASVKTPRGSGTVTGIYTVFGWEKQLVIRDTADAFASGEPQITSWLIGPTISLNGVSGARLSFETRAGFDNGAKLEVLASSNYDGSNVPSRFRWTPLTATIATGPALQQSLTWTPSGSISLAGFKGNIRLAFRYTGSDTGLHRRTTTFHLDKIRVLSN